MSRLSGLPTNPELVSIQGFKTASRLLSRSFMIFSAFSAFTPTSSRASRKCLRNKPKCLSFSPWLLDSA